MDIPFTDPTSLSFLPPRHDLESDSEDEHLDARPTRDAIPLTVDMTLRAKGPETLLVLVGKGAMRFGQGLDGLESGADAAAAAGDEDGERVVGRISLGEEDVRTPSPCLPDLLQPFSADAPNPPPRLVASLLVSSSAGDYLLPTRRRQIDLRSRARGQHPFCLPGSAGRGCAACD